MKIYALINIDSLAAIWSAGALKVSRAESDASFDIIHELSHARINAARLVRSGATEIFVIMVEAGLAASDASQDLKDSLPLLNQLIFSPILVVDAFISPEFQGIVHPRSGMMRRADVKGQLHVLAHSEGMDFICEVKLNSQMVYCNFAFWIKRPASEFGMDEDLKTRTIKAIKELWSITFPRIPLPLTA